MAGAIAAGTAAGTAPRSYIVAGPITETAPGTAATTVPVVRLMVPTVRHTIARATTHPPELTRGAERPPTATAASVPAKRITQGPGLLLRPYKDRTPMEATGPPQFRKTATPPTASIRRPLRERQVKCTLQMGVQRTARRESMATALPSGRPPMATSMRRRTAIRTKTLEVGGVGTPTIPRNTTPVTREAILVQPKAGADKKRAADHRRSAEPAAVAGNPSRQAHAVHQAWVGVVVGVDAAAVAVADELRNVLTYLAEYSALLAT